MLQLEGFYFLSTLKNCNKHSIINITMKPPSIYMISFLNLRKILFKLNVLFLNSQSCYLHNYWHFFLIHGAMFIRHNNGGT